LVLSASRTGQDRQAERLLAALRRIAADLDVVGHDADAPPRQVRKRAA
jgi:hypothetical protein